MNAQGAAAYPRRALFVAGRRLNLLCSSYGGGAIQAGGAALLARKAWQKAHKAAIPPAEPVGDWAALRKN